MFATLMAFLEFIFNAVASVVQTIVKWTVVGVILLFVTICGFTAILIHLIC